MIIVITGNKKEVEEYIKSLSSQVVMAIGLHPDEEYALAEKLVDEAKNKKDKDIYVVTYSVFLIDALHRLAFQQDVDFKILAICGGKVKEVNPISTYIPCLSDIYFKFYLNQDPSYPNRGSE